MARKLKALPEVQRSGGGREPKYNYEQWFDGDVWALTQGKDFDGEPATMANLIRGAAKRAGGTVKIVMAEDGLALQFDPNGVPRTYKRSSNGSKTTPSKGATKRKGAARK